MMLPDTLLHTELPPHLDGESLVFFLRHTISDGVVVRDPSELFVAHSRVVSHHWYLGWRGSCIRDQTLPRSQLLTKSLTVFAAQVKGNGTF
jgi:hypothetical protein